MQGLTRRSRKETPLRPPQSLYAAYRPEVGAVSGHGEKQLKSTKQPFFLQPYLLTLAVPLRRPPTPMPPAFMSFILLLERAGAVRRHAATHVYQVNTTSGLDRALPVPSLGRVLPVAGRGGAGQGSRPSRGSFPPASESNAPASL